jgi:hypothetical protein
MKIIPPFINAQIARVIRPIIEARRTALRIITSHPILLIPASATYGIATVAVAILSGVLGFGVASLIVWMFAIDSKELAGVAFFFAKIFFVLLAPLVWLDYLYLAFRCFTSTATLKGYAAPILRVVQLVGATVFIFAVAHYYVALFSDGPAYKNLTEPVPERGWRYANFEDRLIFVPSIDTVLDCIYFSTVTMATVGYGDVYPMTRPAKILTIIQIIFSFGLIAVVLGWVIGHAKEEG